MECVLGRCRHKAMVQPDSGQRLGDDQIINHFPNHGELTRKDMLVKMSNVTERRWKRSALLDVSAESAGDTGALDELDFVPATHTLPADYSLRRGVSPASLLHLDHETSTRAQAQIFDQQAFADQEVGNWWPVSARWIVVDGARVRGVIIL